MLLKEDMGGSPLLCSSASFKTNPVEQFPENWKRKGVEKPYRHAKKGMMGSLCFAPFKLNSRHAASCSSSLERYMCTCIIFTFLYVYDV
jgi:hypothetical protein